MECRWKIHFMEGKVYLISFLCYVLRRIIITLLLLNTLVLQMYELYIKTNPWTPASKVSFTLLTVQPKGSLSPSSWSSCEEKSISAAANIPWSGVLTQRGSFTNRWPALWKVWITPCCTKCKVLCNWYDYMRNANSQKGCKAEGDRKISIRFASFTGTRNTILRRNHFLGAKQALMWMLALSQLTPVDWQLINL